MLLDNFDGKISYGEVFSVKMLQKTENFVSRSLKSPSNDQIQIGKFFSHVFTSFSSKNNTCKQNAKKIANIDFLVGLHAQWVVYPPRASKSECRHVVFHQIEIGWNTIATLQTFLWPLVNRNTSSSKSAWLSDLTPKEVTFSNHIPKSESCLEKTDLLDWPYQFE